MLHVALLEAAEIWDSGTLVKGGYRLLRSGFLARNNMWMNVTQAEKGNRRSNGMHSSYRNLAYSALASFRMGMSGSASFQSVRKS